MDEKTAAEEAVTFTQKSSSPSQDPLQNDPPDGSFSPEQSSGWNDPPKWAFSPMQSTGTNDSPKCAKKLNKRVAFPLSSNSCSSSTNQSPSGISLPGNLPPPSNEAVRLTSAPHAPVLAPSILQFTDRDSEIDKTKALSEAMDNLEIVISKELESSSKKDEVRRRLETMKIMWEEDKLKNSVYEKVLEISKALRNNDVESADKIHISLMMDDAALCNTWISGIRHIILELREKSSQQAKLSSGKQDEHPYLLPQFVQNSENE